MIREPDLQAIVAQASTIDERLQAYCVTPGQLDELDKAAQRKRFAVWQRLWRTHPSAVFARRVALNEDKAVALLGKVKPVHATLLPPWSHALVWISSAISRSAVEDPDGLSANSIPFIELLLPVVDSAQRQLSSRLDGYLEDQVSSAARADLRGGLLSSLSRHCAEMLYAEFDLFRRFARTSSSAVQSMTRSSRIVYDAFIHDYRENVGERLTTQPVLARILGTVVHCWLEEATELLLRLRRDGSVLRGHFGVFGQVTSLDTHLSDPHHGRRHVAILGFADGTKIVYKPKDVRVDVAWRHFLGWLADHRSPFRLRAANILDRDGYGWSEFIASDKAPLNPAFYRHAGAFLAILHMFQAKDFHHENVVTANGRPVAIDLETLFHPTLKISLGAGANDPATASALRGIADSVIATNYLPLWVLLTNGQLFRMSGVDGAAPASKITARFHAINTDGMILGDDDMERLVDVHLGAPGDDTVPMADQISALCEGFEAQYLFLHSQKDALMAPNGPVARFRGLYVRVVIAGTGEYARVARLAQRAAALGDGVDWSLPFDTLSQDILSVTGPDTAWSIAAAQRNAMARLDVPFFLTKTDATWIQPCYGRYVEGCVEEAPLEKAGKQLTNFSSQNLRRQLGLIRAAIMTGARQNQNMEQCTGYEPRAKAVDGCSDASFGQIVLSTARELVEVISGSAMREGDGVAWVGIVPVGRGKHAVGVLGTDLYYGIMGPALFLAAFARNCGDAGARELARAAVASTRRILDPSRQGMRSIHRLGLGGHTGLGSILYGLVQIATCLEEPSLFSDAIRLSQLVTSDRVMIDRALNVSDGAAGAILGLLALHRATGEAATLEAAIRCGRHLLACRPSTSGIRGWPCNLEGVMRFSHGAAGIAFALSHLSAVAGDDQFRDMAIDLLREERGSPQCTGVPIVAQTLGVALAEAIQSGLPCAEIVSTEYSAGLEEVATLPICPNDSLAEGNCLILDLIATADPRRWAPTARDRACHMILQSHERGGFALNGIPNDLHPGLIGGLSGIGYTLLRLADPGSLPSVITLQ
jgi:type 2 lantibiotic biosynthesis protein LanM